MKQMAKAKTGTKTAKKPTAKKPTAKKPAAKAKKVTKKPATKAKATATKVASKKAPAKKSATKTKGSVINQKFLKGKPSIKRPPNNPDMPMATINHINAMLNDMRGLLDNYSQHLRALDRKRLNGVGIKTLGFIERSFELASENEDFLPHYLTLQRFDDDIQYFLAFRSLFDLTKQIEEKLWNVVIQSADIAYTDALEFYASVREAAKRRVDPAETIFRELSVFFKNRGTRSTEPTEKQLERDAKALIHGKKDGKMVIENIKPKLVGGKHKVIDEMYRDKPEFKKAVEGKDDE
jgi:hypothetical protein